MEGLPLDDVGTDPPDADEEETGVSSDPLVEVLDGVTVWGSGGLEREDSVVGVDSELEFRSAGVRPFSPDLGSELVVTFIWAYKRKE